MKKLISIVTPCYNEEENIKILCEKIKEIFLNLNYDYEHIVIDNKSIDNTIQILRSLAKKDKNLKIILNNKNYGHIRSPYHAIMQSKGEATILISSDFQDPLELIPELISKWKNGSDIVMLKRKSSSEKFAMRILRNFFYKFISGISETKLTQNTTGSGIYDKKIIENLKKINDPYPYFRGLVTEFTDKIEIIEFHQPLRKFGKTKNNFYSLYDIAILGIIKHSKFPIRAMIMLGFFFSIICLLIAFIYLILKILFWSQFSLGLAPLIIGIFGIASFQILLLGILGEYVILILTHARKLPLVVEEERINF
jgi:glycosyltransferase involved in cell wall biosynthesis